MQARFDRYHKVVILDELLTEIIEKLKVDNVGSETEKYLRAQALANLQAYGFIDPNLPRDTHCH